MASDDQLIAATIHLNELGILENDNPSNSELIIGVKTWVKMKGRPYANFDCHIAEIAKRVDVTATNKAAPMSTIAKPQTVEVEDIDDDDDE